MKSEKSTDFLGSLPVGYVVFQLDNHSAEIFLNSLIVYVNAAFEKLTGATAENILQQKPGNLLKEPDAAKSDWLELCLKAGRVNTDKHLTYFSEATGLYYKVQAHMPDTGHLACVFTDISSEMQTEKRYRVMVASENDLVVRVNLNNRFTFVNQAYCRTFGKSCGELIGSDFFPLVHEDDREATAKAMDQLYKPPYRCYLEQRALTVSGWRWLAWEDHAILDNKGNIIEVQGVGRDITALKEKEEALVKQTTALQNLLLHTPAVIYAYSIKNGQPNLHYLSDNVINVLGYQPEEFMNNFEKWVNCLHPDDLHMLSRLNEDTWVNSPLGEEMYLEYRFRDKKGVYHWIADRKKNILNSEGNIETIGAWVDISEQKKVAESMMNYQKRLSLAQKFAKTGSWEYDIKSEKLTWSPECEELFGLETGSFEGTFEAFLKHVHPDDIDYVLKTNAPIVNLGEGVSLDYEHRIITGKGELKWVKEVAGVVKDASGESVLIIGLIMDITERKKEEHALESEKKLRDIVDNINGIFWLRSANRQEMLYISPAYETVFGMSCESLYENPSAFVDAVHPEDKNRVQKAYASFIKSGSFEEVYRILRPDGEIRWIDTKAFPVKDNKGEVIRYAGISADISQRKKAEESEKDKANSLNATISAIPDLLFFMSKSGVYLDVYTTNPEKLLAPKEVIIGRHISDFFSVEETKKQLALYARCIDENVLQTYNYSIEIEGREMFFEARLSPVDEQKLLAIVRDITQQKLDEENLKTQTSLLRLLMEISNTYIDLTADKLDLAINYSLRELGRFMQADRCYVFEYDYAARVTNNTHEWCAEGIEPEIHNQQNTPFELFPEWLEAHQNGKSYYIHDVLQLPEDNNLRGILAPQGIKSIITVPLMNNGISIGFVGFDAVKKHHAFSETEEQLLRVFAKMLVSVQNRITAEKAMQESEIKFQTAFMTSPYALILSKPNDGSFVEVNQAFVEVSGYSREEALRNTSIGLNLWQNPADRAVMFEKLQKNGSMVSEEFHFKDKNGNPLIGLVSAQLIELGGERLALTSINNITEKKHNENLIRKSEERFRQIVESNQTVIWETDANGLFTYVSPIASQIWGYSPEELIGKFNLFDLHPEAGRDAFRKETMRLLNKKLAFRSLDNPIQKATGETIWVSTNGIAILDENGKITGIRGSDQDISAQKALLQDLLEAKEKAEESDRLKSAFLATFSHELRTPLNHVLGFSSLIMDMTMEEETRQFATLIHQSGTNFLAMIEDIFDLALIEQCSISLRLSTFKGTELFVEAKNNLYEILHESGKDDRISLIFKPQPSLLMSYFTTDRQKVNQVLTNLFKNAVKFTASGSIEFGFFIDPKKNVAFYVKDTGIGIQADKQDIIFEFFRQIEDSHTRLYDGLGIGLAISKRLAEVLDAQLTLESEPNMGSCFYFTVPVELTDYYTAEETPVLKEKSLDLSGKTLLIVEDDPTSTELILAVLDATNAKTYTASHGKEAIELAEKHPEISLVLMDLKMPVMDGYQATRLIKTLRPELKVIALTAYALSNEKPKALEAGCDSIITKPLDKTLLFNEIIKQLF